MRRAAVICFGALLIAFACGAKGDDKGGAQRPPDAAILIEGQSNAFFLLRDGGARLRAEAERLLGFDGQTHRIALLGGADLSSWSASVLLPRPGVPAGLTWLEQGSGGLREGALQTALDRYLGGEAPLLGEAPVVIVWVHNESDSLNGALTDEGWARAVRFALECTRRALGRTAETAPAEILSVPFDNYGALGVSHADRWAQRLRAGFALLAADRRAGVFLAPPVGDSDMSGPPERPGSPGGMHFSAADSLQAADRLALAVANRLAALARPGSAEAQGALPEAGPEVRAARRTSRETILAAVPPVRPLSAAAARGAGWAAVKDKEVVSADRAVPGPGGLSLHFPKPVPACGRLFYGYGGGRIFPGGGAARAPDFALAPGRGAAVLGVNGLPLTAPASGLAYDGCG